jgi:hypothetical protein
LHLVPRAPKQGGLGSFCFGAVQNSYMKWRGIPALALLLLAFALFAPISHADTVARGFKAKGTLEPGLIVALSGDSTDTVQAATEKDPTKIYGVVIDPAQAPFTVQKSGEQAFVATGGSYPTLVSTQNGAIKEGDYISISSINGVGEKAKDQPTVLGKADSAFDGSSQTITTTSEGYKVGRINVSIIPGRNPLVKDYLAIPAPLKRFGEAIAGKNISALRIYVGLSIFTISAIIALSVLLVGVRSSITAIGRNPLSRKSILSGLFQVVTVAFLVFIVGMFGVYLLLRL